ncbi:response regulator [Pontibacillus salicampi]|uniref:Response regulator n=1 Tax=Pontibacillus salicampi TaxID=1449801 RepID=A0ABV6LR41_9BACI
MYRAIIVDDETLIKKSITAIVQKEFSDFSIVGQAKDGVEALQLCKKHAPHLIITDIRMPKMNGLHFIEKVRETNQHVKFIIISGYDEFEYAQRALRNGVVDFLLKPIKPSQLVTTMKKVRALLIAEQSTSDQRTEWLYEVKSYAEMIAEHIWMLEEDKVDFILEDIHQSWMGQLENEEMRKRLYKDFLTYVDRELKMKAQHLSVLLLEGLEFPSNTQYIKDYIKKTIHDVMNVIKQTRNYGHHQNILTAVAYINEHFMKENISLQEVSGTVGMSPSYFSTEFKGEMGVSFKHYITSMRMQKAKDLLHNPIYKTYEVAHSVGYPDYPHFTKTFKKHAGMTPTQYRKRLGVN